MINALTPSPSGLDDGLSPIPGDVLMTGLGPDARLSPVARRYA